MDEQHASALTRAISPDRLGTYLAVAKGDRERALELYVWDRDVTAAVLADIAIVEVAVRNALNEALTALHGADWYTKDLGLDDRCRSQLAQAWDRLGKHQRTPGRVVARMTLGFWANLLDAGGSIGRPPQQWKADYETLWRSGLSGAFRGGSIEAAAAGERFTRSWTHSLVSTVLAVRNRAAHHEPMLTGIPLPGQRQASVSRISIDDGYATYRRLLRMVDRDLDAWLVGNSTVVATLSVRP